MTEAPLIVQQDRTVLLETQHPAYEAARDRLSRFAELEKSPEYVHFYRITPISVWNAAALGESARDIVDWLASQSRFPIAPQVLEQISEWHRRYGLLRLVSAGEQLELASSDAVVLAELVQHSSLSAVVRTERGRHRIAIGDRGFVKQALVRLGYPVDDRAGYTRGSELSVALRTANKEGRTFALRDYQRDAAAAFHLGGSDAGGCGVVVLPCGAGKTVVGIAAIQLVQANTLVLTTNTVAVRQWVREILDKTNLREDQVGEYTGEHKQIRPVTVATYQILTHRKDKLEGFTHLDLFDQIGRAHV